MNTHIPSKEQLLRDLDGIGHAARVERMALLGRKMVGTVELRSLLADRLRRARNHPDPGVRAVARRHWTVAE